MSFWSRLTGSAASQFLDVIQWQETDQTTLVYRADTFDQVIQDSSRLVVADGQSAVFQCEGTISESFGPGTYELNTRTPAIWSFFQSIQYGMNNPYKGQVFFINTRQMRDQRWGTPAPFPLRDPTYGLIKLRAFGSFAYRVVDSAKFVREVVGNNGLFTNDDINSDLKTRMVSSFQEIALEGGLTYETFIVNYSELGESLCARLSPEIEEEYGVRLTRFVISNVSVDPEDEARVRRVEEINVFDENFDRYREMRQLDMMDNVSNSSGGGSNPMLDAGMGLAMGQMMGNMMNGGGAQQQTPSQAAPPPPAPAGFHYNGAAGEGQFSAQVIAQHVAANRTATHNVWQAGWAGWKSWQQVPEIASLVPPPQMAPPPAPGAELFHYNDGTSTRECSAQEVAAAVQSDPDGVHNVWQAGWENWKAATEVAEIQQELNSTPPAPPAPPNGGPPPLP